MSFCTHTHSYWAGIVRTCPLCFASYDKPYVSPLSTPSESIRPPQEQASNGGSTQDTPLTGEARSRAMGDEK